MNKAVTTTATPTTPGAHWVHRLLQRLYGLQPDAVINAGPSPERQPADLSVAAHLYQAARALQAAAYSPDTGRLDYGMLAGSPLLAQYRQSARRLQAFDPATLATEAERLAFWINLYNALIIDAVVTFSVKGSVQKVKGFFWRAAYNVGGRRYAAHDIEHGILRAHAPHPAIPGANFARSDPRHRHSLARLDPRIHFAVVCGARSCPPIAVYEPREIDAQLDLAARSFVNGRGVQISLRPKSIWLSRIFQWYAPDFGAAPFALGDRRPLLAFVAAYLDGEVSRAAVMRGDWAVRFLRYDWRLNNSPD